MKKFSEYKWYIIGIGLVAIPIAISLMFKTAPTEAQEEDKMPVGFSMYDWHTGIANDNVKVADIYGRNQKDDNACVHVRKVDGREELWLCFDDACPIKWLLGFERITYQVSIMTKDYAYTYSSACTCIHNENGNVLRVDYPQNMLKLFSEHNEFFLTLLRKGKQVDTFHFDAIKPLEWNL